MRLAEFDEARNDVSMVRRYRHRPNPAFRNTYAQANLPLEGMEMNFDGVDEDEAEIRTAWRELVNKRLPAAAKTNRDWPVYLNHCFARILLDNAVGQFWRDVIKSPAWKNTPLPVLQTAIDLGEDILSGDADIWKLNDHSLKLRGKPPRGRKAAVRRRRRYKKRR